jgi:hypothetical protein
MVFILLVIFYTLAVGLGMHIARHLAIYLIIASAALLPALVFAGGVLFTQQSPVWMLFLDLLGDSHSRYAGFYALAMLCGFIHGVILYRRHQAKSKRHR